MKMSDRIERLKQSDEGKSRAMELFYFHSDSAEILSQLSEQPNYGLLRFSVVMSEIYQQMAIDDQAKEDMNKA